MRRVRCSLACFSLSLALRLSVVGLCHLLLALGVENANYRLLPSLTPVDHVYDADKGKQRHEQDYYIDCDSDESAEA
jgi:hypothetical protein